jgi:vancomycin permeability regulator SanA
MSRNKLKLRRYSTAATYAAVGVVVLLVIHILVISHIGLRDNVAKADAVVVFGNTVNPDGTLSNRLKSRLEKGLELYNAGYAKIIIVSGALGKEGYDEAEVMRAYLIDNGVPANAIIQDSQGVNTHATARNTKQILDAHCMRSAILVSQYFHIPRAELAFKQAGILQTHHAHSNYFELRDLYSLPREVIAFYKYLFIKP